MNDLRQIRLLKSLAAESLNAATLKLAHARRALNAARQQLQILGQYHLDYKRQMQAQAGVGLAGDTVQNFQRFVQNVDAAIAHQQAEVVRRETLTTTSEAHWRDCQSKLQAYVTLEERALRAARLDADRVQQKQSDEFASNSMQRALAGS